MMYIMEIFGGWEEDRSPNEEAGEVMVGMKCMLNGFEWWNARNLPIYPIPMTQRQSCKILEFITPILIMEG